MVEAANTGDGERSDKLSGDEQKALALDWFMAMWDEALKRGVKVDTMCIMALSATTSKLAERFGDNQTAELLKSVRKNVLKGQFTFPAAEDEAD